MITICVVLTTVCVWGWPGVEVGVRGEALDALETVLPSSLLHNLQDLVQVASSACELVPVDLFSSRVQQHAAGWERAEVVEVTRAGRRVLRVASAHLRVRPALHAGGTLPVYVPGWWNTPSDEAAEALVAALLTHHPTVLILDTRRSFGRGYLAAAAALDRVSHHLYALVESLGRAGVPPAALHLIGFSLGAHAAGAAGRLVRERLRAPLGRITALDPAKPCFTRTERRLRKTDAAFVHVVHSSAGVLGLEEPLGHVDVYVNGVAVRQPQCRNRSVSFECDHNVSWRVFAASVGRRRALAGRRCAAWPDLLAAACAGALAPVGYGLNDTLRGMYLYRSGR